jgi:hypothetical protein
MGLVHAEVVVVADDPTYPVGSDEWNEDHLFTGGAATQVLFQGAANTIESDAGLTYNKTTDTLGMAGGISAAANWFLRAAAPLAGLFIFDDGVVGTLNIGDKTPTNAGTVEIGVNATWDDGGGSYNALNIDTRGTLIAAGTWTGNITALNAAVIVGSSANSAVSVQGVSVGAAFSGANNLTGLLSAYSGLVGVRVTVENTGAGVVTEAAGVNIHTITDAAGSITTLYGLKIENQAAGGTNYALHTGTGQVLIGQRTGTPAAMAAFDSAGVLCETPLPGASAQPISWGNVGG